MFRWIITYEDESTLDEILKTGVVVYKPKLDVKYIFMDSYLDDVTIMKIKGVKSCREPVMGALCSN